MRSTLVLAGLVGLAGASWEERLKAIDATRGQQIVKSGSTRAVTRSTFQSMRSAELEKAGKAMAEPEMPPAKTATKKQSRRLQSCPSQYYTISTTTDSRYGTHDGSWSNPVEVIPGCPHTLEIVAGNSFYAYLPGFNVPDPDNSFGLLPQLSYSWSVDSANGETILNLFSLRAQPRYQEVDLNSFWDWYFWPLLLEDGVLFREDTITGRNVDYYHCYSGCGYEADGLESQCTCGDTDLRTQWGGTAYLTANTALMAETITVVYLADTVYNNHVILANELQVIKDMYNNMCAPWKAPAGWEWESHQFVESSEVGEQDTRNKPYCDWLPFEMSTSEFNALTTQECHMIPGVICDDEGHVRDIFLNTRGLRGALPSNFGELTNIEYIELQNNRIEGPLPTHIFDSSALIKVDLYGNQFSGEIPCPAGVDNKLIELTLANNDLTGIIPNCIFENMPALTVFDASRNLFDGPVPTSITQSPKLAAVYMQHSGLTGPVGTLAGLPDMGTLDVSHNYLMGEIDQPFVDGMPRLYRIDVSWNQLTGALPVWGVASDFLRRVELDHNKFSGAIDDQFTVFAEKQTRGALSGIDLSANGYCGDLPFIFYELLMDPAYYVYYFDVTQNHFHCAKDGNNQYWPAWAMQVSHDFGMCIPIPVLTGVVDDIVTVDPFNMDLDTTLTITGQFVPTTEGTCSFMFSGMTTPTVVPAVITSTTEVKCVVPKDAPEGIATVTVAHYCDDYSSAETLEGFVETTFFVEQGEIVPSGSSKKKTKTDMGAIIGGAVAGAVALCFLAFLVFMCCMERSGKPLFKPLKDAENPLFPEGKAAPAPAEQVEIGTAKADTL